MKLVPKSAPEFKVGYSIEIRVKAQPVEISNLDEYNLKN